MKKASIIIKYDSIDKSSLIILYDILNNLIVNNNKLELFYNEEELEIIKNNHNNIFL